MADEPLIRTTEGLAPASAYGYGPDGPHAFSARAHLESPRAQLLARRAAYFTNRQHDDKQTSWDNHLLPPFQEGHTPLLSMGGIAEQPYYTPLFQRRPCAPYRLPKLIVRSFTALLFGEGRFPEVDVLGDDDAQDWLRCVCEVAEVPERFEHLRDVGGACGTAGLSWRFWNGSPRVQVHPGTALVVQEWADRELLVPAVATELQQYDKQEWDPKERAFLPRRYWRRRDWTPQADVTFVDMLAGSEEERVLGWQVDAAETVVHGEGEAHLVWVPNAPDFDGACEDGVPDYEGLFEDADMGDLILSVLAYGGAKNLDPTLLLRMNPDTLKRVAQLRKGSDNAIATGEQGDARYLEVAGSSISAGLELLEKVRQVVLECAGVVAHDPERLAAATNASALKLLYAPMLAVRAGLMGRYGRALKRLLGMMLRSARLHLAAPAAPEVGEAEARPEGAPEYAPPEQAREGAPEPAGEPAPAEGEEGPPEPQDAQEGPAEGREEPTLAFPPRLLVEEQTQEDGTVIKVKRWVERDPGTGGEIQLRWPDPFPPTAQDKQLAIATLSTAAGGRAVVPLEMAVREAAKVLGRDEDEAWRMMQAQLAQERESQATMFPSAGDVGQPAPPPPPEGEAPLPEQAAEAPPRVNPAELPS